MKLTRDNCKVSKSEKGNLYITHPNFRVQLRFYADIKELQEDPSWRSRVSIREGDSGGFYAVLAKTALEELDL